MKVIENHLDKKIKVEIIDTDSSVVTFDLKFPRGHWKNTALESYYKSILLLPIHELTLPLLRLSQVSVNDQHVLSLDEALSLSSKFNQILSKNSWILPYSFENNNFSLSTISSVELLNNEIKKYLQIDEVIIEKYHGCQIEGDKSFAKEIDRNSLEEILKNDVFILQGVTAKISDFKSSFIGINFYLSK